MSLPPSSPSPGGGGLGWGDGPGGGSVEQRNPLSQRAHEVTQTAWWGAAVSTLRGCRRRRPGDIHIGVVPRASTLVFAGFALTRLRRRWRLALSMEIGLVLAVALAVSVTVVQSVTAEIGLRRTLDRLGDQGWVQITGYGARDGATLASFRGSALAETRATMGPLLRPGASFLATSELIPISLSRDGSPAATGTAR